VSTAMSASLPRTLMVARGQIGEIPFFLSRHPVFADEPGLDHHNVIDVSPFSDDVAVPSLGMHCKRCGPTTVRSSNPSGLPAMPPIRP
jgi:hypothetical protein